MAKRQSRLPRLKDDAVKEREAVEKLLQKGVPGNVLLLLLRSIQGASNKKLELAPGIEERTLRNLPDQIHKLADRIRGVNDSPWLAADGLSTLDLSVKHPHEPPDSVSTATPSAELKAMIFSKLPRDLGLYADHLRAWLNRLHPVGSHGTDRVRMQTLLTIKLLMLVRESTGRPHYEEVATLLNAAYRARGKKQRIDAGNLQKLAKDNPRLSLIAHFLPVSPQNLR